VKRRDAQARANSASFPATLRPRIHDPRDAAIAGLRSPVEPIAAALRTRRFIAKRGSPGSASFSDSQAYLGVLPIMTRGEAKNCVS
jgi:hypothetical protein